MGRGDGRRGRRRAAATAVVVQLWLMVIAYRLGPLRQNDRLYSLLRWEMDACLLHVGHIAYDSCTYAGCDFPETLTFLFTSSKRA